MPTQQDYRTARTLALEALARNDLSECCNKAGVSFQKALGGCVRISIPFLGKVYDLVVEGDSAFFDQDVETLKLQDQVLLLHYLITATGTAAENRWITFREVPSGPFYYPSFLKRAVVPLVNCFGNTPENLQRVAGKIGQLLTEPGDVAVKIPALPRVPVVLSLWKGDDEFPPQGNVYFDPSIASYLSTEDIAYLAGSVVYTTIGMARSMTPR